MSRYIDAEWLSKLFPDTGDGDWTYNVTALGYIDSAPSIDIVRCKECVEYDDDWCMYWQNVVNAYDFCSYGERREP